MDVNALIQNASVTLIAVAWKVVGALVLWLAGRWLISFAIGLLNRALAGHMFDETLMRYLQTALRIVLNMALIVAILGFFGVETTTFAALLAAGGVAIVWPGVVCWPTSRPGHSWCCFARSKLATRSRPVASPVPWRRSACSAR